MPMLFHDAAQPARNNIDITKSILLILFINNVKHPLSKAINKTAAEKLRRGMYYAGQHRGYSPGLCHDTLHNHLLRLVIILCPIAVTAKDY